MKKKLFSILMVICMVITLIPTSVKAENVEITDIKVTVQTPEVGTTINYDVKSIVTTPETEDCMELVSFEWWYIKVEDYTGIVSSDPWHKVSNEATFEDGYYYSPKLFFKLKDGYKLATNVTGSVNGYPHSGLINTIGSTPGYVFLLTDFVPTNSIDEFDVSVASPRLGTTADYDAYLNKPIAGASVTSVNWVKISEEDYKGTDEDKWTELESDEKFTTGYYYGVNITVKADDTYYFSKTVKGSVNGQEVSVERSYATSVNMFVKYDPFKLIKTVKVTTCEPEIGKTIEATSTVVTDPENATSTGYTVWAKIAKSKYTGKKDDPWQEVTEGEKFEDGYYYMVAVEMLVVDSYYADETTVGTINGREHNDLFGDFLLNKESAVIDEVPYGLLLLTIYEPVSEETVPSTGENSPIYLMLAVMALSGVTFAVVDKKRKK